MNDQKTRVSKAQLFINPLLCLYLQIYPDEGHFLHSEGTQQHLSQSLVNFFEECFRVPEVLTEDQQDEDEDDS